MWVLLPSGELVSTPNSTPTAMNGLSDPVVTEDGISGILVGMGGAQGSSTEFPGHPSETQQILSAVFSKATRLAEGNSLKFDQHFKDHRDLLIKAVESPFPISPEGKNAFLLELRKQVFHQNLRPIGAATLARDQPIVYVLRGNVGTARLTLVMKPNGDFQTLVRSNEGLDKRIVFLMRFDTSHPYVFARYGTSQ